MFFTLRVSSFALLFLSVLLSSVSAEPILFNETPIVPIKPCEAGAKPLNIRPVFREVDERPEFLESFLKSINPRYNFNYKSYTVGKEKIFPDYTGISKFYKKWCSLYSVRWDWAFMQMLLETNYLRYTGSVPPQHYNFAGLAATTSTSLGEGFQTISRGVKAHCQHLAAYALLDLPNKRCKTGDLENLDCLEAQRTIDVKDKIIRNNVCKQFGRPAQFSELGPDDFGPCTTKKVRIDDMEANVKVCPDDIVQWASGPKASEYFKKIQFIYKDFREKLDTCRKTVRSFLRACLDQPSSDCPVALKGRGPKDDSEDRLVASCIEKT